MLNVSTPIPRRRPDRTFGVAPRRRRVAGRIVGLTLATVVGVGCGSDAGTTAPAATTTVVAGAPSPGDTAPMTTNDMTTNPMSTDTGAAAMNGAVTIADFAFAPAEVRVAVGGSVEWTNTDPHDHAVVADDGSFQSDSLPTGATFRHTFDAAGTYTYHCGIHPSMTATVVVTG